MLARSVKVIARQHLATNLRPSKCMFTMTTKLQSTENKKSLRANFFRFRRSPYSKNATKTINALGSDEDNQIENSDDDANVQYQPRNQSTTTHVQTKHVQPQTAPVLHVPEYVFVMLIEFYIVLIAGLGCLFLVSGPSNTFPVAPTVMWVANLFTCIGSTILCYFTSCILNRLQHNQVESIDNTPTPKNNDTDQTNSTLGNRIFINLVHVVQLLFTQTVAFDNKEENIQILIQVIGACWEAFFKLNAAYNIQFLVFSVIVTFLTADVDDNASNDHAIILFNGNHVNAYGYGVTRIIILVTSIFVCVFVVLMLIIHSYMQKHVHQARISFWIFFAPLFIQTQYIQYYNDKRFNSNEKCTYSVLDIPSCDVGELRFAFVLIFIWWLAMFLDRIVTQTLEQLMMQDQPKFSVIALFTIAYIFEIPVLLGFAIEQYDWLRQPHFYFINMLMLIFLWLSRVRDRLLLSTQQKKLFQNDHFRVYDSFYKFTSPAQPRIAHTAQRYGTAQPRIFFRRPNTVVKRD